ncbi:MAG TPA: adenylate/guanylate cyclase domain-containing protein, partial [Gemmatimonadota bacterium]|nr:adenylate/guanylate cyclase domain-containing protein [Gemmatimonadota bacterium]
MISKRSIATVLFTDIVGSTEKAAALGDRRWREVLHQHRVLVREQLGRFGGKEIATTGDGFLAVFDDSARAIVCAAAVRDRVAEIGLQVRCGVHMGQVERSDGDVSGIAVHIGARVAAHARPGEVLVSATVREAERGSDFEFEDRGGHELKGVPGELRLYALASVPDDLVEHYDIGGVRVELDQALATSAPVVERDAIWQRRLLWALASVGLVAVSAVGVWIWMIRGSGGDTPPSVTRTTVTLPANQQLDTQARAMPLALSPDGQRLVYVAHSAGHAELHLRNLDAFEAKPMGGTEGARYPFFSPDGQWVAFFADDKLKRVPIQGGSPVTVCNASVVGRGGTWGPDGTIVFDSGISGLMRVAADGGIPEPVVSQDAEMDARNLPWPQFLPHGRALLATAIIEGNATLVVLSLDTGTWRQLGRGSQAQYVPPGHLVFHSPGVKEGELQAVRFDVERLAIRGEPVSVLDGVFRSENGGGAYFAVAKSGALVFAGGGHARTLVRVDRNGRRAPLLDDRRGFRYPRVSPDGRRVAVTIDPRPSQIWIYDLERGSGLPLATDGHNLIPVWTPDSQRVAYTSNDEMYWRVA